MKLSILLLLFLMVGVAFSLGATMMNRTVWTACTAELQQIETYIDYKTAKSYSQL